ncbi:MAG: hypothetical protein QXO19_03980 [Candidatus Aenigmatarchaeota archaeon]
MPITLPLKTNAPPPLWEDFKGKPYVTVSSKGLANGLSDKINDGADFGPDTPGTLTYGIQEAINAISGNGGIVYLKAGNYYVSAPIIINTSGILLEGEGSGIGDGYLPTAIINNLPTGSNNLVTNNTRFFSVKNILFDGTFGNRQTGGALLYSAYVQGTIENCSFHVGQFDYGINFQPAITNIDHCFFGNSANVAAIYIRGGGNDFFISNTVIETGATGIIIENNQPGLGVIQNVDITHCNTSLQLGTSGGSGNINFIKFINCNFDAPTNYGIYIPASTATFLYLLFTQCTVGNGSINNIYWPATNAIPINVKFTSCVFRDATQDGIVLAFEDSREGGVTFESCSIVHSGVSSAGTYSNIKVPSGLTASGEGMHINLYNCELGDDVVYNDTIYTKQVFGIESSGLVHLHVEGGKLGSTTAGLLIDNSSYLLSDSKILNITGYNPQGFKTTTPSVPASGTAVQNTNPYPVMVYISGGSGTAVAITPNGSSTATTVNSTLAGQYRLEPYDSITLTYSTAPTWQWYGL